MFFDKEWLAFSCVSLVSFNLEQLSFFFKSLMTLSVLKSPDQCSCRMPHILDLSYCFFMSRFRLSVLG